MVIITGRFAERAVRGVGMAGPARHRPAAMRGVVVAVRVITAGRGVIMAMPGVITVMSEIITAMRGVIRAVCGVILAWRGVIRMVAVAGRARVRPGVHRAVSGRCVRIAGGMFLLCMVATPAAAQTITSSSQRSQVGFIGGFSVDPEQGFVGVFWRSPEIGGRVHLRPGIDGGFGEDMTLATVNIDFIARFPFGNSGWEFVQGGGPAIVLTRFESFGRSVRDIGAGGSYVLGFAHDGGFLGEFRIGGGTVPSLKVTAGYSLGF